MVNIQLSKLERKMTVFFSRYLNLPSSDHNEEEYNEQT